MEKNTIQLSGFNAVERMDATVSVDKFAQKMKHHFGEFDELAVVKKDVHAQGIHAAFEINVNFVAAGKRFNGRAEGHSLKTVIDQSLGSIESALEHKH